MSLNKLNKKGDEKLLSFWMFIIWFAIAFFIVYGVYIFYSAKIDVKEVQAKALSNRIIDCISDKGIDKLIDKSSVFSECDIYKDFNSFYFRIEIFDVNFVNVKNISAGDPDIEMQCVIREKRTVKAENFAVCVKNEIITRDINDKSVLIKILTGSNNAGGKV